VPDVSGYAAASRLEGKATTKSATRWAANRALARGFDQATDEMMRPFFYLPFMHSELLADQDRCVRIRVRHNGSRRGAFDA
jgi:uncharacterized protein (DUF924 family)